jgi:hypothetical protein
MDGMIINGLQGDGAIQTYTNDAGNQEMVYQTGGGNVDSPTGGVKINLVPKEGGNRFTGSIFQGYESSSLQSDNLTPYLADRGVKTVDKIGKYNDTNFTLGGPIKKDTLWFFGSGRFFTVNKPIANTALAGQVEREPRHLRSGRVDRPPDDAHDRRTLGVRERTGDRTAAADRALRRHSRLRYVPHADMENVLAAPRRGARSLRYRQDGRALRVQSLPGRGDDNARVALRSGGGDANGAAADGNVERQERRRHRAGRQRLQLHQRSDV